MTETARTQWPAAHRLQAAADAARADTDPRLRAVADHLDVIANNMAWLAPYNAHEPGLPMWDSANDLADAILRDQPDPVAEHEAEYLRAEAMTEHMHDFKHEETL